MKKTIFKQCGKHLFIYFLTLTVLQPTNAQFFQELFDKAKSDFNSMLKNNANRLTQEGLNYLGDQAEKITVVSSKKRDGSATTNNYVDDKTKQIPTNETESYLKKNYPKFYYLYSDVIKDPYVSEILFIIRENSSWGAQARPGGKILFDLNQFDIKNGTTNENTKCWGLLIMQGFLHQMNEKPKLRGAEKEYYAFEFALKKARYHAENGHCSALKNALKFWKNRKFPSSDKESARNQLIQSSYFIDCESWFKTASCGGDK